MVSSSGSLCPSVFHHSPCGGPLCEVSQSIRQRGYRSNKSSFYNVEKDHIRPVKAVQIHYTEAGGITGHVMLLCMMLMYTTSHQRIRQQSFETFWYTHHLFVPFLLALYTHATGCFVRDTTEPISPFAGSRFWNHCLGYEGWRWELVAGGLYMLERLYREIRARRHTVILKVVRHPYGRFDTGRYELLYPNIDTQMLWRFSFARIV